MKIIIVVIFFNFKNSVCQNESSSSPGSSNDEINDPNITLYINTKHNPIKPLILTSEDFVYLNFTIPTKVIIHGWLGSAEVDYCLNIKDAYFKRGNYNVIRVDWSELANKIYFKSASSVELVGRTLAHMLLKLIKGEEHYLSNLHLIGHSLGSHVAGFAGKEIQILTEGKKFGRITALDPAGPFFEMAEEKPWARLAKTDAEVVDVLHTDIFGFGYRKPLGTVDFYANPSKRVQNGCGIKSLVKLDIVFCSHGRSHEFFVESINFGKFLAFSNLFEKKIIYGEDMPLNATGVYYFFTKASKPFALYRKNIFFS